jgi:hypothetical protein
MSDVDTKLVSHISWLKLHQQAAKVLQVLLMYYLNDIKEDSSYVACNIKHYLIVSLIVTRILLIVLK